MMNCGHDHGHKPDHDAKPAHLPFPTAAALLGSGRIQWLHAKNRARRSWRKSALRGIIHSL